MPTQASQNSKKRGTLRDTFTILFILISCIPIILFGIISIINTEKIHKNNISEIEHQTLLTASEITLSFFNSLISTLSINFDSLQEGDITSTKVSWQELYTKQIAKDNPSFLEVSIISNEGKEVAKYSKISTSTPLLYLSELPIFKRALKGETVISPVHTTLEGQTVTLATPIKLKGEQEVTNVVIAEVDISRLVTLLEKIRIKNTGYVLLFDSEGTLIGSKNTQPLRFFTWDRVARVLHGEHFNALSLDDRYESPISSLPVVGSATLIQDMGWVLFAEWPTIESDSIIENFRITIIITTIITIFIVLLVALFLAYKLIKPIRDIQEATYEIEKGNFDKQLAITTNNELEELGDSFNTMSLGLKRLEELKNEFVYVAAHELRAPVTAIKGYIELIFNGAAGSLTPEMEHLLSPIQKSNERLVNLVNDLLKVARSEAGKLEITISPSDIRKGIHAILDETRPLLLKKNIQVTYSPEENLPDVMINEGSFKEVIMNFISNAIKYGNDNGTITIIHTVENGFVSTSITDNGRGISKEDQEHLFEKFFRATDVKKTTIEGTGLGLFITKELIEKMGGTLKVSSELGVGTTFKVAFKQV